MFSRHTFNDGDSFEQQRPGFNVDSGMTNEVIKYRDKVQELLTNDESITI